MEKELTKYLISYGLGGGMGGRNNHVVFESVDRDEAEKEAWYLCCEEYESYVGMYGLRTLDEIMEEDELDEDEAEITYNEERESWLDYLVEEYDEEKHSDYISE